MTPGVAGLSPDPCSALLRQDVARNIRDGPRQVIVHFYLCLLLFVVKEVTERLLGQILDFIRPRQQLIKKIRKLAKTAEDINDEDKFLAGISYAGAVTGITVGTIYIGRAYAGQKNPYVQTRPLRLFRTSANNEPFFLAQSVR